MKLPEDERGGTQTEGMQNSEANHFISGNRQMYKLNIIDQARGGPRYGVIATAEMPVVPRIGEELAISLNQADRQIHQRWELKGKVVNVCYNLEEHDDTTYRPPETMKFPILVFIEVFPRTERDSEWWEDECRRKRSKLQLAPTDAGVIPE